MLLCGSTLCQNKPFSIDKLNRLIRVIPLQMKRKEQSSRVEKLCPAPPAERDEPIFRNFPLYRSSDRKVVIGEKGVGMRKTWIKWMLRGRTLHNLIVAAPFLEVCLPLIFENVAGA
jgi:hypothetical protein